MNTHIETFDTDGVLILANIQQIALVYADQEFDYGYPEGLEALIRQGILHIVTTEETVENLNFTDDAQSIDLNAWNLQPSKNYLQVGENEEIRLVSHATFTMTCAEYKGDFQAYIPMQLRISMMLNPELKASGISEAEFYAQECPPVPLKAGIYKVSTYAKANPSGVPSMTFLFDAVEDFDAAEVTTKPLEVYG